MDSIENTTSVDGFTQFCSYLAKFSFFVFIFFTFFGTSMPFKDGMKDATDITTSDVSDQVIFSGLYVLSFIGIIPKRREAFQVIRTEKFFTILILWCFASMFWSDAPFVSFKRWIQIVGMTVIMLSALLHLRSADDTMQFLKLILSVYLPLSIAAVLFVPGAIQWEFPAWRGIASHKNTLGQISLVSLIIWSYALGQGKFKNKLISFIFWSMSLVLLIGARSVTAFLTAAVLLTFISFLYIERKIFKAVVGSFISSMFFIAFFLSLIPVIYFGFDFLESLPGLIGRDLTFSGRVYLWADVFEDARNHLLFGCGFGGYWVPDTPAMDRLYKLYLWLPNQAHLGYLDLMNEIGIMGLVIFALMILYYFINLSNLEQPHFWKLFVVSLLISNLSETSLFKPMNLVFIFFIFAYLALFTDIVKNKNRYLNLSQ